MSEIIREIEEVNGLRLGNIGRNSDNARLGIVQMMNAVFGGYGEYDGYKVKTTEHEYLILIDNGQCCCESWGYFDSADNTNDFIGKELMSVELTDVALSKEKLEESGYYGGDCGGIQFVDFNMADGTVLQFAVYNDHNGYYGHPILVAKDENILLQDTL